MIGLTMAPASDARRLTCVETIHSALRQLSYRSAVPLALLLSACSGAQISTEHFDEGLGQVAPVPRSGGVGPVEVAVDVPVDDLSIPTRPPDLLAAYRLTLIERAHVLPHDQAEAFADAEIAALQRAFEGRDEALTWELRRRLDPAPNVAGDPDSVVQRGPVFPSDPVVATGSLGDQQ